MRIEYLVNSDGCLISVFCTEANYWQYALLFSDSSFYCPHEIYISAQAAYRVAIQAARTVMDSLE